MLRGGTGGRFSERGEDQMRHGRLCPSVVCSGTSRISTLSNLIFMSSSLFRDCNCGPVTAPPCNNVTRKVATWANCASKQLVGQQPATFINREACCSWYCADQILGRTAAQKSTTNDTLASRVLHKAVSLPFGTCCSCPLFCACQSPRFAVFWYPVLILFLPAPCREAKSGVP